MNRIRISAVLVFILVGVVASMGQKPGTGPKRIWLAAMLEGAMYICWS